MTDWSQFRPVDDAGASKVDWSQFKPVVGPAAGAQVPIGEAPPDFGEPAFKPGDWGKVATGGINSLFSGDALRAQLDALEGAKDSAATLASNAVPVAPLVGALKGAPNLLNPFTADPVGDFVNVAQPAADEFQRNLYTPKTKAGELTQDALGLPGMAARWLGEKAQDLGAPPALSAGIDTAAQVLPFALGDHLLRGGEPAAPRPVDPVQAATAPTVDTLNASEHIAAGQPNPQTAQAAQGTASLMDAVRQATEQVQSPPVPNPVTPAAPPVQEGRGATPPPPPALAAKLQEITGGDSGKMASIIQQATGGKLEPGETPQSLVQAAQDATQGVKPRFTGAQVARGEHLQPEAANEPARTLPAGSENGGNGTELDRAPEPVPAPAAVAPPAAAAEVAPAPPEGSVGGVEPSSWIIRDKNTGRVIMETFDPKKVSALNTNKYEAVPVGQHLSDINRLLRAGKPLESDVSNPFHELPPDDSEPVRDLSGRVVEPKQAPVEQNVPQLDPARMNELRQARDAGTITPEQHAELNQHLETALSTADVGGEHIPGLLNQVGRAQLEASGKMKPFRAKTDIDDFKEVNDTLGHDIGDEVLRAKGKAMVDAFGPGNAWREGGDEFGAHADTAEELHAGMAKVKQAMKDLVIEGVDQKGKPVAELPMGVSYGVGEGETPKLAAKAADNALYVDKAARTAAGERTGRRSTDAQVGEGVGAGSEGQGRGDVPGREQAQVAVAERTEAPPRATEKPVPEGQTEVSARNASIDADRLARDLPEIPEAERQAWSEPHAEALAKIDADPNWPKRLAAEVAKKPRPLTATETMGLTHDLRELTAEHSAATKAVLDARAAGDTIGEAQAVMRQREAEVALTKNHEAIRVGGTEAARAMSIRNAIVKDDYSIGRNMDRAKAAYGDKFDPETKSAIEHLSAKIKEQDERIAELEKQREAKARAGQPKTADERMQEKLQKQMDELNAKIQARLTACPI